MLKLTKIKELNTEDFTKNSNGYEHSGNTLYSVSEFYNVSVKEKETLFILKEGFQDVSEKMVKKQLSFSKYLQEIEKLNKLIKGLPNISININHKNEFIVSVKAELKEQYQTDKKVSTQKVITKKPTTFVLHAIEWEESERGWGTRPDGFSFHRSQEEATKYLKEFFAKQPKEVPDEYSRPINSNAKLIEVSEGLHNYVLSKGSVWLVPTNASAYKTYDASHLNKPKNKI